MKLTVRYFGRATGRHRAPRVPGQLAPQEFVHCPTCKTTCAATVHGTALLCTEGGHVIGGEA
jgi:hypothetical protein